MDGEGRRDKVSSCGAEGWQDPGAGSDPCSLGSLPDPGRPHPQAGKSRCREREDLAPSAPGAALGAAVCVSKATPGGHHGNDRRPADLPPTRRTTRQSSRGTIGSPAGWSGSPGAEGSGREQRRAPKVLPPNGPKDSRRPQGEPPWDSGPALCRPLSAALGFRAPFPQLGPGFYCSLGGYRP